MKVAWSSDKFIELFTSVAISQRDFFGLASLVWLYYYKTLADICSKRAFPLSQPIKRNTRKSMETCLQTFPHAWWLVVAFARKLNIDIFF